VRRRHKNQPGFDAPDLLAMAHRVTGLDNPEILDAMDTTLSNLCRYVADFRHTRDNDYLGEIGLGAQALYTMSTELAARRGAAVSTTPTRQVRGY